MRDHLDGLAGILLERGGVDVVFDFLAGRAQCMDTMMMLGAGRLKLRPTLARTLADRCARVFKATDDERERNLAELGLAQCLESGEC